MKPNEIKFYLDKADDRIDGFYIAMAIFTVVIVVFWAIFGYSVFFTGLFIQFIIWLLVLLTHMDVKEMFNEKIDDTSLNNWLTTFKTTNMYGGKISKFADIIFLRVCNSTLDYKSALCILTHMWLKNADIYIKEIVYDDGDMVFVLKDNGISVSQTHDILSFIKDFKLMLKQNPVLKEFVYNIDYKVESGV